MPQFDIEDAKRILETSYGKSRKRVTYRAAVRMGIPYITFYKLFRKHVGKKPCDYLKEKFGTLSYIKNLDQPPLMTVDCGEKIALVAPHNIRRYLKEYALESMEEDYGFLKEEIRTALGRVNLGRRKLITARGNNMEFVFERVDEDGNGQYVKFKIRKLKIPAENVQLPFLKQKHRYLNKPDKILN